MPLAITPQAIITLMEEHHILDTEEEVLAESDLFALGLDSLATMQLLLQLERSFGVLLSPASIRREHFATPAALAEMVNQQASAL
ncbi:MAG: phosphopantetheine-binding protein [Verrucomicrobiota bacterium]